MNRFFLGVLLLIVAAGCTNTRFKKLKKSGLEYKIFSGNGGTAIKYGNTIKFKAAGYYKDSVLSTPYDSVEQFVDIDSMRLPPDYITIFKEAKKGDSIVTRILVDTAMKYGQVPPFAKKGNYLGFRMKVLDVITDPAKAATQKKEAMNRMMSVDSIARVKQKITDDKVLSDRITKEKINAVKTTKGTYVEVTTTGEGAPIDSGMAVTINYRGSTLEGKEFDKSYDSSGKAVKPYTFIVGQRGSIEGMDDGIRMFKKGGAGRIFIPSTLGYGSRGAGADIKPNECLVFDVKVVDVMPADQYKKQMSAQNKAMQQLQKMQQMQKQIQPQERPDSQHK